MAKEPSPSFKKQIGCISELLAEVLRLYYLALENQLQPKIHGVEEKFDTIITSFSCTFTQEEVDGEYIPGV